MLFNACHVFSFNEISLAVIFLRKFPDMSKVQDDKQLELGSPDKLFEQQAEAPAPSQS